MKDAHPTHMIYSLEELLSHMGVDKWDKEELRVKWRRFWTIKWNKHVEKHGNVPMKFKCSICSGEEFKKELKAGRAKLSQPDKVLRRERKEEK